MDTPIIRRKIVPENPVPVGARFARLLIVEDGWEKITASGYKTDVLKVRCDCGVEKFVRPSALTRGTTVSCGCLQREHAKKTCLSRTKHGDAGRNRSPEYGVYSTMLSRCYNPNTNKFADYGGRGIEVCDRWRGEGGYERFIADMGRRPHGFSIDRIDSNGPYSPENCRWANSTDQANNRRSNRMLTLNGVSQTLSQWARQAGLKPITLSGRLDRGWDLERAITTPIH